MYIYVIYTYKHRETHVFYKNKAQFHCKGFTTNVHRRRVRSYLNVIQMQTVHIFQAEIIDFKSINRASSSQLKRKTLLLL